MNILQNPAFRALAFVALVVALALLGRWRHRIEQEGAEQDRREAKPDPLAEHAFQTLESADMSDPARLPTQAEADAAATALELSQTKAAIEEARDILSRQTSLPPIETVRTGIGSYAFKMLKRALDAEEVAKIIRHKGRPTFERWDGASTEVACISCPRCQNYFWVQHLEVEAPSFCCYCGRKSTGVRDVSDEEMRDQQTGM